MLSLHAEHAERGNEHAILFVLSLLCEYCNLECVHIHVVYRVDQAELRYSDYSFRATGIGEYLFNT